MAAVVMKRALCGLGGVAATGYVASSWTQASSWTPGCSINKDNSVCKLNISINGENVGAVEVELFDDTVPKTTKNFRLLCAGNDAFSKWAKEEGSQSLWSSMPHMSYAMSPIHRIIPGFMLQAGDFTRGNGTGGMSIYGSKFKDESFDGKAGRHNRGSLSMANSGTNTNGSQFFITFESTPWLNGKHVVFGQVISGMDIVDKIEKVGTRSGRPLAECSILSAEVVKTPTGSLSSHAKGETLKSA